MPRPAKRASSRSAYSDNGGRGAASHVPIKKRKANSTADAPAVAEPEPAPSSAQIQSSREHAASDDQKIILGVLANIRNNPTRIGAVEASFGLLKQLVQSNDDEDLMKCIVDAGGISVVTTIMKNNPDEDGLWGEGGAILDLLIDSVNHKPEKELIKAIIVVMRTLRGNVAVQTRCCHVLQGPAKNGFSDFIGECGGIPVLLSILKNHPNQKKLLKQCLEALEGLTSNSESICKRIAVAGGIRLIVDTLLRHSGNAKVQCGIAILGNLACDSKERTKAIIEADGHAAVVLFMENHPQNVFVQECGCWDLTNLACGNHNGVYEKIVDAGAIPAVVEAMTQHPNDVEVQRGACSLLCKLSEDGNGILAAMNQAGARAALAAAIEAHLSNKDIKTWAKEAWVRLVESLPSD